jgi:hypothetical protein
MEKRDLLIGMVVVGVDNVSLEVKMELDELLAEYVQVVHESIVVHIHDKLHLLQAWRCGPKPGH